MLRGSRWDNGGSAGETRRFAPSWAFRSTPALAPCSRLLRNLWLIQVENRAIVLRRQFGYDKGTLE